MQARPELGPSELRANARAALHLPRARRLGREGAGAGVAAGEGARLAAASAGFSEELSTSEHFADQCWGLLSTPATSLGGGRAGPRVVPSLRGPASPRPGRGILYRPHWLALRAEGHHGRPGGIIDDSKSPKCRVLPEAGRRWGAKDRKRERNLFFRPPLSTEIFRHLGQLQALILQCTVSELGSRPVCGGSQVGPGPRLPGSPELHHQPAETGWRARMGVRGLEVGEVVEGQEGREIRSWLEL